jgi:quercetin dioxygenase-like cupin family protein
MATTRRSDSPAAGSAGSNQDAAQTAMNAPAQGSPRPTFDGPAAIPYRTVTRYLWGDETSGEVSDWIYASTDRIHMLVFALPPGGRCLHSDTHRTVFGADVTYFVIDGTLVLANPENDQLRVLEFFAPPPSTGTSRKYAQTRPLLQEVRYTNDDLLGRWPVERPEPTLHHRTSADAVWRRDGDALVGVVVTTEHLTVGTLNLLPGQHSDVHVHGGDEALYVLEGVLNVRTWGDGPPGWEELHPGDGFYCPIGTPHRYSNIGDGPVKATFGVAPLWR